LSNVTGKKRKSLIHMRGFRHGNGVESSMKGLGDGLIHPKKTSYKVRINGKGELGLQEPRKASLPKGEL